MAWRCGAGCRDRGHGFVLFEAGEGEFHHGAEEGSHVGVGAAVGGFAFLLGAAAGIVEGMEGLVEEGLEVLFVAEGEGKGLAGSGEFFEGFGGGGCDSALDLEHVPAELGEAPFGVDHVTDVAVFFEGIGGIFFEVTVEEVVVGFLFGVVAEEDGAEEAGFAGVLRGTGFTFVRDRTVGFCAVLTSGGGVRFGDHFCFNSWGICSMCCFVLSI